MAKLSARGRAEVARVVIESLCGTRRTSYAMMTDGRILRKFQYKDSFLCPRYGTGGWAPGHWSQWRRLKEGGSFSAIYKALVKKGKGKVSMPASLEARFNGRSL